MTNITLSFEDAVEITSASRGGNAATFLVDMTDFPQEILVKLAIHGLQQKVADSCADKNKFETLSQVKARSEEVIQSLKDGVWAKRGGGGRRGDAYTLWLNGEAKAAARMAKQTAKYASMKLSDIEALFLASVVWRGKQEVKWAELQAANADLADLGLGEDC